MVDEIRIYVEGGGDYPKAKTKLREGFSEFLRDLVKAARNRGIRWSIIACGSCDQAFDDFSIALETHPDAFNVLLVDSDGPVSSGPWMHLQTKHRWDATTIDDEHCHLMIQMMEAWLIADTDALSGFYGKGFHKNALSNTPDVEQVDKSNLLRALKNATRKTAKGEYHKTRHGFEILKRVDTKKVRGVAPSCDRLFITLENKLKE